MTDYARLAAQLNKVRWAWKRKTVLAGLAKVLLESLALFTLIFLVDWLYQPRPTGRVVLWALALAALVALVVRHVLLPLLRRIPDEQLALYVEEHRDDFQGALVTATEFGRATGLTPRQADLIHAVVDEAAARTARVRLRSFVNLGRLRKYGAAAVILLVVYVGMCLVFPQSVGHHAARVLTPWRATPEDLSAGGGPSSLPFEELRNLPVEFTLSQGDSRVPRGGGFDLEAVLSRPSDTPVVLRFRPVAEGEDAKWRELPMKEIEKLNGFGAALRDISEDLEFRVATGPFQSDPHRITVYNPLALAGVQVTTRFPGYLKLPDRVETGGTGDVSAPIGSAVTVRILTNNPLADGQLAWQDGPRQGLAVDPGGTSASTAFDVEADGVYTFKVRDRDGQELLAEVPSYVRALKDQPPVVQVKHPRIDMSTHPLGQVTVVAETGDDFAVESLDLVYQRGLAEGRAQVRVPLALAPQADPRNPRGKSYVGTLLVALEDLKPRPAPGTMFTYHLEARDQKGQKGLTDIYFLSVVPFEQWATWGLEPPEFGTHGGALWSPLTVVLAAVWHLHTQKDVLPPDEFNLACDTVAKSMVDPDTGEVFPFIKMKLVPPNKKEQGLRVIELAKKAHAALVAHDTAKAVEFLRMGVAELTDLGLSDAPILLVEAGGSGALRPEPESALAQIAYFMEQARTAELAGAGASRFKIVAPEYRRELRELEEAEELQEKAEDLQAAQQGILDRAVAMAEQSSPDSPTGDEQAAGGGEEAAGGGEEAAGGGEQAAGGGEEAAGGGEQAAGGGEQAAGGGEQAAGGGEQAAGGGEQQAGGAAGALAADQAALAATAKAVAMDARELAGADPGFARMAAMTDDAARDMFLAAANMRQGNMDRAVADIQRAQGNLAEAVKSVQGIQRYGLEQAVDLAMRHAERILKAQGEARTQTLAVDAKIGAATATPDAARQRDLGRLAFRQGEIRVDTERLNDKINNLREMVQKGAKPDTARAVEEAQRGVARHRIVQKMTNAAVELDGFRPKTAAAEQTKAVAGVEAVLGKLREAAGTLASDYKSELARAKFEADRIAGALAQLGGGEPVGGEEAGGEGGKETGGEGGNETGGEGGKETGGEGGNETGGEGGEETGGEGGKETGGEGGEETGNEGGTTVAGGSAPLSGQGRRELGERVAADIVTFVGHLEGRQFAPDEAGQLKAVSQDQDVLARIVMNDDVKRGDLLKVVRRASNKLEAELEAKLEAERLKDFQREECPPQYRHLVNKYYEILSQGGGTP